MFRRRLSTSITEEERSYIVKRVEAKKSFAACLGCGGVNLKMISDKGYLVHRRFCCRDCGYEGSPIMFKDLAAYEKFFRNKRLKYNLRVDEEEVESFLSKPFEVSKKKNPFIALLVSLIFPGAGQLYLGELRKAWAILFLAFIAYVSISFLVVVGSLLPEGFMWVMYTPFIILYIVVVSSSMDAFFSARRINLETR